MNSGRLDVYTQTEPPLYTPIILGINSPRLHIRGERYTWPEMIFWVPLVFWFSKLFPRRAPLHGYGIALHIQRASDELLQVEEGSLYPALHRMEQNG